MSASSSPLSPLLSRWLVEAVRLRESLWGPLADDAELRTLRARALPLDEAVTQRAEQLARREGLADAISAWRTGARLALVLMAVFALALGASTAAAALGDAARPVNLLWAVSGLLGLHLLTFLVWLGGLVWALVTGASTGGALGTVWLALSRRAASGPSAALAPQSLVNLMGRARLMPWLLGAVSHAFWLLALSAALLTLLAMLATRRYDFVWETTILDPGYVERLALWLGSVPGMLGLPTPDAALVRASDGLGTSPGGGRAIWAAWLLGVLVVYGIGPRALALAACLWQLRRGVRRLPLDLTLPGLDTLAARLQPASRRTGIIDPAPSTGRPPDWSVASAPAPSHGAAASDHASDVEAVDTASGGAWAVWVEVPADLRTSLQASVHDAGAIDSGASRASTLERLHAARPERLLIVCDARQTADRGTVALVVELAGVATQARILLAGSATASPSRRQAWVERLAASGLGNSIVASEADVRDWLAEGGAAFTAEGAR